MSTLRAGVKVLSCSVLSALDPGFYLDEDAGIFIDKDKRLYVAAQDEDTVVAMKKVMAEHRRQNLWHQNSVFYPLASFESSKDSEIKSWRKVIFQAIEQEGSKHEVLHGGVANNEVSMASD